MVMAERQKGRLSPGNWQWQPCHPLGGGLGRTPLAAIASTTRGLAIQDSGELLGGRPEAHLLVAVQGRGRYEGLLQTLPASIAGIVMRNDYVVEV